MNIFYLDPDPKVAATFLVNAHAAGGKMIVESAQMLASAYSLDRLACLDCPRTQEGDTRKHSYFNHPCTIWARTSLSNHKWLVEHGLAIAEERMFRCGKSHFTTPFIQWCENNPPDIPDIGLTKLALAMPDEYKISEDPVVCYREYYRKGKSHLADWNPRNVPDWYF